MKRLISGLVAITAVTAFATSLTANALAGNYGYEVIGTNEWEQVFAYTSDAVREVRIIDDATLVNNATGSEMKVSVMALTEVNWDGNICVSFNSYGWETKSGEYSLKIPFDLVISGGNIKYGKTVWLRGENMARFVDAREPFILVDEYVNDYDKVPDVVFELNPTNVYYDKNERKCYTVSVDGVKGYITEPTRISIYGSYSLTPGWGEDVSNPTRPIIGDVNNDGDIDSTDASIILQYAAEVGAGYEGTIDEYLR